MKNFLITGLKMVMLTLLVISCDDKDDKKVYEEVVAVTNRGGNSITFINANTNEVLKTLTIAGSEPMYVVYVPSKDKLYVGDRAGKKVYVINPITREVENSIPVGNGVFHMWADGLGNQLWVNNDIDNTISVINLTTNAVIQTINVGKKPHDVFLTKDGTKAYVSILETSATTPDKVFLYNTATFTKTAEASVGKDPHLFHLSNSNRVYVPCQSGEIFTLNGNDLTLVSNKAFAGAHGVFGGDTQNFLFVTNISGNQLYTINPTSGDAVTAAITTSVSTPHNVVANEAGNKLFVSHSGGTATAVTTYAIATTGALTATGTITSGTNPFGITYYKR